jgi:hypothetical protein
VHKLGHGTGEAFSYEQNATKSMNPLPSEENQILEELLRLAGGMPIKTEIAILNEHQKSMLRPLQRKGYVFLTKKHYSVVRPPKDSN